MKKNMHYTDGQQADINRLHVLLEANGIDTHDKNRPASFSDSALFRFLIEDKLKQLGEAAKAGKKGQRD